MLWWDTAWQKLPSHRYQKCLLIYAANTFEFADVKAILATQITRMGGVDLTTGFVIQFLFFQGLNLRLGQYQAFCGNPGFERLQAILEV